MIELTEREIEAIENILEYDLQEEQEHCEEYCLDQFGTSNLIAIEEKDRTGHIYWDLLVLEKLLNRVKKERK